MFANYPPDRVNSWGARWNPEGVSAIYTSLDRDTALAEAEHQIASQPIPPKTRRTIYRVRARLRSVLDLANSELLSRLGITAVRLGESESLEACQRVGAAASWLGRDGILVPSARRATGVNLVIFPSNQDVDSEFTVLETVPIM